MNVKRIRLDKGSTFSWKNFINIGNNITCVHTDEKETKESKMLNIRENKEITYRTKSLQEQESIGLRINTVLKVHKSTGIQCSLRLKQFTAYQK